MNKRIAKIPCACLIALLGVSQVARAIPEIQNWTTDNGAKVLFVQTDSLPIIDMHIIFAAGSARDDQSPGLALLANGLMSSGAGDWNADQIAARLDSVGALMGNQSERDMAMLSLRSLIDPAKLTTALAVLKQVLTKPQFNKSDLDRDRQRLLVMLQHKQQQPGAIGSDAFYRLVFGDHPYAIPPEGTAASLAKISRADLQSFHRRYYVARNAVLAIVGDLDRETAERLANELLGALPAGEPASPLPAVQPLGKAIEQLIEMPTMQTHIIVGQPGIARGDKDYYPLYVGNHILGGSGFSSRLMQAIREDRGLAYDVHSFFWPMAQTGPFIANVQTRNEQAGESRRLLIDTIRRFRQDGPTRQELEHAVQNITGSFPLNVDSNADLVSYLGAIGFYNLPLDHLQTFIGKIKAVTAEQVRDAFRWRLDPERFATVIVGPAGAASASPAP